MADTSPPTPGFTGRTRQRQTKWLVRVGDAVARSLITVGGIGTILAILGVCVFLVWVVAPLFLPARVSEPAQAAVPVPAAPLRLVVDEYQTLGLTIQPDGTARAFRLDTGQVVEERRMFEGAEPTAWSFAPEGGRVTVGFADGSVRSGTIGFGATFLPSPPAGAEGAAGDGPVSVSGGVALRTREGHWRAHRLAIDFGDPVSVFEGAAVALIDSAERSGSPVFAALSSDGQLRLNLVRSRRNRITRKTTYRTESADLPYTPPQPPAGPPRYLRLSDFGDNVFLAWADGRTLRYDARQMKSAVVAEELDLIEEPGATLTALEWLLGEATLISGDSTGRLRGWFRARVPGAATPDGETLVAAHELPRHDAAVTSLAPSSRVRMIVAGHADGHVRLVHVTSHKLLADVATEAKTPVLAAAVAPKDDALLALTPRGLWRWPLDARHPEATPGSLFTRVWYEGEPRPVHVWQSSSGHQGFEPKYGLIPLVFGTLKATVYSLLFGVPIALLAAVYTSEFLHPRIKSKVKPGIELMASLPSVVLGFLAALVIAPVIEHVVPAVLASMVLVPLAFLVGAQVWQLLPYERALRLARFRFLFILAMLPVGVAASLALGPAVEAALFNGDIKAWLDGQIGRPDPQTGWDAPTLLRSTGGWLILLLPLSAIATTVVFSRTVGPWLRTLSANWDRQLCGLADLAKFVVGTVVALLLAYGVSVLLMATGFDPRGSYVDTYVQRNALIVGFVMGFAIIPIIYTIAEDALSSVPEHLRSASLGAGATPWQTAVRIIIPTAMSGLFSAVMIGVGRAVGETMIVLMATGNTPVMEWNIFSGFRTLSANIAVELPEAVRDSTHYRTLFLAALTLFVLTFALNTVAESVRQRFRRRAYQL